MQSPVIAAYWKVINSINKSLPSQEDVLKSVFHLGRAANEVKKGFRVLRKKKRAEGKADTQPKRIMIE
jgi:hypothetical protein